MQQPVSLIGLVIENHWKRGLPYHWKCFRTLKGYQRLGHWLAVLVPVIWTPSIAAWHVPWSLWFQWWGTGALGSHRTLHKGVGSNLRMSGRGSSSRWTHKGLHSQDLLPRTWKLFCRMKTSLGFHWMQRTLKLLLQSARQSSDYLSKTLSFIRTSQL